MSNLGQYAKDNGFTIVQYMDTSQGQPGTLVSHEFNPNGGTMGSRYGIKSTTYTYIESQHVGSHTGDRDHQVVTELYTEALGLTEVGQWDIFDLNLVKGLTEHVIKVMNEKGLKGRDEQGGKVGGEVQGGSGDAGKPTVPDASRLQAALSTAEAGLRTSQVEIEALRAAQREIKNLAESALSRMGGEGATGGGRPVKEARESFRLILKEAEKVTK